MVTHPERSPFKSGIYPKFDPGAVAFEDDDALLRGLLADDPRAWRVFQVRFDRLVVRSISKVTEHFRALVAPDEVSDIRALFYVSLLANDKKRLRVFDPQRGTRFCSWIAMLASNRAYDYIRARRREPEKTELAEAHSAACDRPDPFERCASGERATMTATALRELSAKDRAFARLYFAEELEPSEVAAKLQVSVKTVYSKKHKVRLRLATLLKERAA
jgi:RNA polymerase sigma-70 factor (ECF subfamily)